MFNLNLEEMADEGLIKRLVPQSRSISEGGHQLEFDKKYTDELHEFVHSILSPEAKIELDLEIATRRTEMLKDFLEADEASANNEEYMNYLWAWDREEYERLKKIKDQSGGS